MANKLNSGESSIKCTPNAHAEMLAFTSLVDCRFRTYSVMLGRRHTSALRRPGNETTNNLSVR